MGIKNILSKAFKVQSKSQQSAVSTQDLLPVLDIKYGMVITKDNGYVKILEVLPVSFYMKSPAEQQNIILNFASYLRVAPDNLQIRVLTQKADTQSYVKHIRSCIEDERSESCRALAEDYIDFLIYLAENVALTRRFFLIFRYEPKMRARTENPADIAEKLSEQADTARKYLDMCGVETLIPDDSDYAALETLYEIISKDAGTELPRDILKSCGTEAVYEKENI